jgi:hypothetical protein
VAYGQATRKVLFYRARPIDKKGPAWDAAAVCKAISALSGEDGYHDDGLQVNRAEVVSTAKPQKIKLFKVRRDELPGRDDGKGGEVDLDLAEEEGLAEAIHICLFPKGIIAAEFFFHGPRIGRFERFVNDKLGLGPYEFVEIVRKDVIDSALQLSDIRYLRVKLDPSMTSRKQAAAAGLDGVLDAVDKYKKPGVYAELVLRAEGGDSGFTAQAKSLLSKIKGKKVDVDIFERLEIEGKPSPDERVTPLDILSERIYRMVEVPYQTARYRALNSDATFAAIRDAYKQVANDLPDDGTVA